MNLLEETRPSVTALASEAHSLLTNASTRPRPHARDMASLITQGLTDQHLKDAWSDLGYPVPDLDLTLQELEATLPHLHTLSNVLATKQSSKKNLRVFAARDAETLYDYHTIVHSDQQSTLLPASKLLMESLAKTTEPRHSREFFKNHGITPEFIRNPESQLEVIDTGFNGTVGVKLGKLVENLYRGSAGIKASDKVKIKLVHANPAGHGETIHPELDDFDARNSLPKTYAWLGDERFHRYGAQISPTAALAMSLQLQPRYHGTYASLHKPNNQRVRAVPKKERMPKNVERYWISGKHGGTNDSIVHPLAATIIQRHVVAAALQRAN